MENKDSIVVNPEKSDGIDFGVLFEKMDDRLAVAIVRGIIDTNPEYASQIFNKIEDKKKAVAEIYEWIRILPLDSRALQVKKLYELIKILRRSDDVSLIIEEIQKIQDTKNKFFQDDIIIELGAYPDIVEDLLLLHKDDADETVHSQRGTMLRLGGEIFRKSEKKGIANERERFYQFGLLLSSLYFGNTETALKILEACSQENLYENMFVTHVLSKAFRYAIEYNCDVRVVKKILEIVSDLEQKNASVDLGTQSTTVREVMSEMKKQYKLSSDATVLAVLMTGADPQKGYLNIQLLSKSVDDEKRKFFIQLLETDEKSLRDVFGTLKESFLYFSNSNISGQIEVLLQKTNIAIEEFQKIMHNIFIDESFQPPRGPAALQTERRVITDVPEGFNHNQYLETLKMMELFDGLLGNGNEPKEWARRFTLMFDSLDDVFKYIKKSLSFALNQKENPVLWQHRTDSMGVNWPENLHDGNQSTIDEIDALHAVLGFNFPTEAFDSSVWKDIFFSHPESVYYLEVAPEIEKYLVRTGEDFPRSVERLKEVVVQVDCERLGISQDLIEELIVRIGKNKFSESGLDESSLRTGFCVGICGSNDFHSTMQRLALCGVFPQTVATKWSDIGCPEPTYVTLEGRKPVVAESNWGKYPDNAVPWINKYYQILQGENLVLLNRFFSESNILPENFEQVFVADVKRVLSEEQILVLYKNICLYIVENLKPEDDLLKNHTLFDGNIESSLKKIQDAQSFEELFKVYRYNYAPTIQFDPDKIGEIKFCIPNIDSYHNIELLQSLAKQSIEFIKSFLNSLSDVSRDK